MANLDKKKKFNEFIYSFNWNLNSISADKLVDIHNADENISEDTKHEITSSWQFLLWYWIWVISWLVGIVLMPKWYNKIISSTAYCTAGVLTLAYPMHRFHHLSECHFPPPFRSDRPDRPNSIIALLPSPLNLLWSQFTPKNPKFTPGGEFHPCWEPLLYRVFFKRCPISVLTRLDSV